MPSAQVFSAAEIDSFRRAGDILHECLEMLSPHVVSGITTLELDAIAESFIRERGGMPAFKGYNGYRFTLCTSVNDECVHGIPSEHVLKDGDIVSLDCGVIVNDLYTDACISVGVGDISKDASHLLEATKGALDDVLTIVKEGVKVGDISNRIQKFAESRGCSPVQSLTGHGLGRTLHQFPDIPNIGTKGTGASLPAGTVVAIEPILCLGHGEVRGTGDGWTLKTADGSLAAHFEHTVLIKEDGCEVIA